MNCKWCDKSLSNSQVYGFLRGQSKGTSCSSKCSMLLLNWGSIENYEKEHNSKCVVCQSNFQRKKQAKGKVCSLKCRNKLSSERMVLNNPMELEETRLKVSNTLKEINHKPIIQGGNGRGATIEQLSLYNEISKIDGSFQMEYIERTMPFTKQFNSPYHYKIDIASKIHKIAIEIDGKSHNTLKIKECDKRKTELLNLKGWKVLRLSNFQIQKELENCVQMVLSMI